jgi:hypothetical protein
MTDDTATKIDVIARKLTENQERLVRLEYAIGGDEKMEIPSLRQEMRNQVRQINERIDKIVGPIRKMFWGVLTAVVIAMTISLVRSDDGTKKRYEALEQEFFTMTHQLAYEKWHGTDSITTQQKGSPQWKK